MAALLVESLSDKLLSAIVYWVCATHTLAGLWIAAIKGQPQIIVYIFW